MKPITILIVDDHASVRASLRELLAQEPDLAVVGEAGNGHQAVALASQLCPDVIMMDIAMPLLDGIDATLRILQTTSNSQILILSSNGDEASIQHVLAMGAAAYLVKATSAGVIPETIRAIHARGVPPCPKPTI